MTFNDDVYGEREYSGKFEPQPFITCRYCDNKGKLPVYYIKKDDLKCGVAFCSCEWGHWHSRRCGDIKGKFFAELPSGVAPKGLPYSEYMQLMLKRRFEYMKTLEEKAATIYEEDTLPIPETSG